VTTMLIFIVSAQTKFSWLYPTHVNLKDVALSLKLTIVFER